MILVRKNENFIVKSKQLEDYIRQYISSTVQAKIDDRQKLDYLSEIRNDTDFAIFSYG
jgi:hypothetical protein